MPALPPDLSDETFRLPDGRSIDEVMEERWQQGLIDRETYEEFHALRELMRDLAQEALAAVWNQFNAELGLPPRSEANQTPPVAE